MPDDGPTSRDPFCAPAAADDYSAALRNSVLTDQTDTPAELHRRILELEHQLKNVLSNVLALVGRAERDATVDADVLKSLSLRVRALSGPQPTSLHERRQSVELSALLAAQLTDLFGHECITLQGAPLALNARAARAMCSVFHELATNAAKYGALSQADGRVELNWFCLEIGGQNCMKFHWREFGGPIISTEPSVGFGTQLMASMITGDLKGAIEINWNTTGATIEFTLPIDCIRAARESDASEF